MNGSDPFVKLHGSKICAGKYHSICVTEAGAVYVWGSTTKFSSNPFPLNLGIKRGVIEVCSGRQNSKICFILLDLICGPCSKWLVDMVS